MLDKNEERREKDECKYGDPYLKVWAEGDPQLEFLYDNYCGYKKASKWMFNWAIVAGIIFAIMRILEIWNCWEVGSMVWLVITYFLISESFRYNDKALLCQSRILDAWNKPKTEKDHQELNKRLFELDEKERKCSK